MYKNKIIFIAALDWGLGHASRCVPLIKKLALDNTIILGVTPLTSLIFDEEFPNLKKINIAPYHISYSKVLPIRIKLLLDLPRIKKIIKEENTQLKNIIIENKIDVVISDNRLGLYHQSVESVYITHQINLQVGFLSFFANKIHHYFIKKYNVVWIPDVQDEQQSLSGKLSHPCNFKNVIYIGILSRLEKIESPKFNFDYLFLLSGPEPQRTLLEKNLIDIASKSDKKIALVRGSSLPFNKDVTENIKVFNLPNAKILSQLITNSNTIICRSGYSSLMDLNHLNKMNLILIPTKQQAEQIYLANYWKTKFKVNVIYESNLNELSLS
ncbi:MAG: glycosyltransferase [Bacteroidota bacterium]